ncbi:MAG: hypothetical protein HY852_25230 [Bradyrhizobium sp.]|nr:hypothetical protein [Bradyrhizobium sp.]
MKTGNVQDYNAMMFGTDAAAFNALDRARTDIRLDGTAPSATSPTRSASSS